MADDQHEDTSERQSISIPEFDDYLEFLVDTANSLPGMPMLPITLLVKGLVVTGFLASGRDYFNSVSAQIADVFAVKDERRERMITVFGGRAEFYKENLQSPEPEASEPLFIHLAKARVFNGTVAMPTNEAGVWWRGRLSEVDGFFLGTLSTRK